MGDIQAVFAGKAPEALATYHAHAALAEFGPFVEEPKKTSIHLNRKSAFAGARSLSIRESRLAFSESV